MWTVDYPGQRGSFSPSIFVFRASVLRSQLFATMNLRSSVPLLPTSIHILSTVHYAYLMAYGSLSPIRSTSIKNKMKIDLVLLVSFRFWQRSAYTKSPSSDGGAMTFMAYMVNMCVWLLFWLHVYSRQYSSNIHRLLLGWNERPTEAMDVSQWANGRWT